MKSKSELKRYSLTEDKDDIPKGTIVVECLMAYCDGNRGTAQKKMYMYWEDPDPNSKNPNRHYLEPVNVEDDDAWMTHD